MTKKWFMVLMAVVLATAVTLAAGSGYGPGDGSGNNCRFIDENGDGINDNFRDHDGDGIPNHLDQDWTRPEDGSGYKNRFGYKSEARERHGQGDFGSFRNRNQFGNSFGSGLCGGSGALNGGNGSAGRKRGGKG